MSSFSITYLDLKSEETNAVQDFIDEWNNDDLYITVQTSGSTGKPKEIRIIKSRMADSARMTAEFLQIREHEKALLCLSPNTIGGKMMIVRAIVLNLDLIVASVSGNPLEKIQNEVDFVAMVPLQLMNTLIHSVEKLRKIRTIIIGGGIISSAIENQLIKENLTVFHTYGMTETISHVAMRKVGIDSTPYFTAIGQNFFSQHENRLVIHSPLLDTKSILTNDIVELIDDKNFIFKGRVDFVINSGGVKIHPEIVEKKLENTIHFPFFIAGLKDDILGEKVILCIESTPFELNKKDIQKKVSKYEVPKEVYFIKEFVRTESGKINRRKTIEEYKNL